jgi:hypothetical protein
MTDVMKVVNMIYLFQDAMSGRETLLFLMNLLLTSSGKNILVTRFRQFDPPKC